MLSYPAISPDIVSFGPFAIRWYGFMYFLGFLAAWYLGKRRIKTTQFIPYRQYEDFLTLGVVGVLLGARFGYILFYNLSYYLAHPLEVFYVWEGGMSFHGGLLGVLIAVWYSAKKCGKTFFEFVDFIAPFVPPGLFFGRIGNFINAELWGKVTTSPLGMVFPGGGSLPRHPSQLYEAVLEGLVLFVILWCYSATPRPRMAVSGLFALGYGVFRFIVEFFREPDEHIGYIFGNFFTMGMLLCVPLIIVGILLIAKAYASKRFEQRKKILP